MVGYVSLEMANHRIARVALCIPPPFPSTASGHFGLFTRTAFCHLKRNGPPVYMHQTERKVAK